MKKSKRFPAGVFLLSLVLVTCFFAGNAFADFIIDNGGSGTSSTGVWSVSGGTSPYGADSLWSRDGDTYTWQFTSQPAGTYEVYMWWSGWSSRATNVPVTIVHRDGSQAVSVNQGQNAGKWNSLGQFYFNGTGRVTIKAVSGSTVSTCADAVRFVNVGGGVNQPPVAVNDTATTTKGTPVAINVISNDTDDAGINAASVAIVTSPSNGTAVPNGSGAVTYTPNGTFTGTDTFRYTVADGQGAVSNAATVSVTVGEVSAEVVIDNGGPGTSFTGDWSISGASNPYGANSVWSRDGSTYTWSFTPAVSGNYDVSMWWTVWPSRSTGVPVDIEHSGGTEYLFVNQQGNGGKWNSLGIYSLIAGARYTVTVASQPDPSSTCADAVKFAYLGGGGNQPPVARNDSAVTTRDTAVSINVISNDTDDAGIDPASVAIVTSPANGTAVPKGDGTVTYTPGESYTGTDTFTYTVADTQAVVSNTATVTVTVNAKNQPPVAVNDTATTTKGTPVSINVISNDTDDIGINPASIAIVTSPGNGTAVPKADGTVTYTPVGVFTGVDTFTYTVADTQGVVSISATVTVTVNAVSAEVVIDSGGPGTSSTGWWDVSGASGSYGANSVWSRDGSTYSWNFTPTASGNYEVSMWWTTWPSRSSKVPVDIRHAGGTTRVTIDQQQNGGRWNSLGLYSFAAGVSYTVTVTSQPGPSSTCADAVKFAEVGGGGNLPPTATIDSITPNPALPGGKVDFTGHGLDSDGGPVFAHSWRSNIDGVLSDSASFSTSALSSGQHTIYFKVQDDLGAWSNEASAYLDVTSQASNTEHIYLLLVYDANKPDYIARIQAMGAHPDGDAWKYTNLSQGKTYFIHIVEDIEGAKRALYTENAHIILTGHSNYGIGGIFPKPGEMPTTVMYDVYNLDDPRIWTYSSPWISVSVRGMISSQAYPNWWPDFQDGTSGIMPYDFNDPRGNPPYNYFISYQLPGDPTHYKVESVHYSAPERFSGSGATPWFSPDGTSPSPTNPDHRRYFIINTDTSGNYGTCGASPCPKPHYGSRTIVFRKDLEVDKSQLRFKRMLIDTCTSGNYYLETFHRGIIFFTKDNTDGNGTYVYLDNYLKGKSDQELWTMLGAYQGIYDYYDFNKRPFEQ